ncbi:MAG: 2-C-methyl-D-erythritol 4-phosphate cytidylyltransferase [Nocardioidaceae bacterium]
MTTRVSAVIPAAGRGERLASPADAHTDATPKALRLVGGRSLLRHALDGLAGAVDEVVVAAPVAWLPDVQSVCAGAEVPVTAVPGGASRQHSVALALAQVDAGAAYVLVHDAARPLVPPEVIARVVEALHTGAGAVVPAVAVSDSLRSVSASGGSAPLDRTTVCAVQTPQGFNRQLLDRAHAHVGNNDANDATDATDDATLVERLGEEVTLVEGDPLAFKVTSRVDLTLAEALVAGQR